MDNYWPYFYEFKEKDEKQGAKGENCFQREIL